MRGIKCEPPVLVRVKYVMVIMVGTLIYPLLIPGVFHLYFDLALSSLVWNLGTFVDCGARHARSILLRMVYGIQVFRAIWLKQ